MNNKLTDSQNPHCEEKKRKKSLKYPKTWMVMKALRAFVELGAESSSASIWERRVKRLPGGSQASLLRLLRPENDHAAADVCLVQPNLPHPKAGGAGLGTVRRRLLSTFQREANRSRVCLQTEE